MTTQRCSLGMVIGPHPAGAEAGMEALRAGGNAFDAIVSAAFAEAVVEPAHNGIGGYGGSMVGYLAGEQRLVCVDFNSEAPAAIRPDQFPIEPDARALYHLVGASFKRGALSVGTPGVVAGLDEIHRAWGTLPLPQLLAPAIHAAREGWICNTNTHHAVQNYAEELARGFPVTAALLMPEKRVPAAGDRMRNPDLADTLEQLAVLGLRNFYEGEIAVRIVAALERLGGLLTLEDLAAYQARIVEPITTGYRGRTLATPPLGSGGVTTFQMLQVLEGFDLGNRQPPSPGFYHLFTEVMKACWRQRLQHLGDPAFTGVSESSQLDSALIAALQAEVRGGIRNPQPGQLIAPDPGICTSHLCAADAHGNVASLTQTHGGHFGSWVTVPGTGITLGHGVARFDPRPGQPNSLAPRKRPLHNMAPIVALQDGRPVAAYGTPGGRTIVNNQAFFSLCLFAFEQEPETALAFPRAHCEEAEPVKLEKRAGEMTFDWLESLGHRVTPVETNGGPAHVLLAGSSPAEYHGATDPRGEGVVACE